MACTGGRAPRVVELRTYDPRTERVRVEPFEDEAHITAEFGPEER